MTLIPPIEIGLRGLDANRPSIWTEVRSFTNGKDMPRSKVNVFVHLVWATWKRHPLISQDIERFLHRLIESEAKKLGCSVFAVNSMPNHVHNVIMLPSTITIAKLTKQMKGVSSNAVNDLFNPAERFKWQGGYGAFSVSQSDLKVVINYVNK